MADPTPEVLAAIAKETHPDVPYSVALSIADQETGFNPKAQGTAGEIGLFQLLPATVRGELKYTGPLEALWDPGLNTRLATQYLKILFDRVGTWPVAIRSYNGSGAAARDYAASVLQKIPTWDRFVNANLKFFQSARAKIGAGVLLLVGALVAAFVIFRPRGQE